MTDQYKTRGSRISETYHNSQASIEMESLMNACLIEAGALNKVAGYLEEQFYNRIQMVVDEHTYIAAGKELELKLRRHGLNVQITSIIANQLGDVIADEVSLVQLIVDIQTHRADVVIAVGGGTLHDISRYAAYTSGLNFISVPTAPSVDGFNSKGAPIIIRGYKKTMVSIGPVAVFADLNVLVKAPQLMIAAGYGDILGKYTSLFDWKFGALTYDEAYSETSEIITRNALQHCVNNTDLIAKRDEEGIALLTRGLMESGVAMLLFGQSHPASGAEHHLSHYWEMEYIKLGRKQLLHGAKVGCACIEIAHLYEQLYANKWGERITSNPRIAEHWSGIMEQMSYIPQAAELQALLSRVGGPTHYSQLGFSEELLIRSLKESYLVRPERYTLLHASNIEK